MRKTPVPARELKGENSHTHILVVDDDASLLSMVVTVLRRDGYNVESAEDGASGWYALCAGRFDLLLTDYSMPNLNGLELLRKVSERASKIPAILMSAAMPEDVGEIIELVSPGGALHKPFATSELLFKVGVILDLERSRTGNVADAPRSEAESVTRRERIAIQDAARAKLLDLASKIMMHEATLGGAGEIAVPLIFRICDKLRRPIQMLSGENGFRAILGRALMLSKLEAVWLESVNISPKGFFEGLRIAESKIARVEIFRGETILMAHLLGLLVTFVGDQMTRMLLQNIWPDYVLMS